MTLGEKSKIIVDECINALSLLLFHGSEDICAHIFDGIRSCSSLTALLSSHHNSRPAQLHLHQKPSPACPASCCTRPGRGNPLGHHRGPFIRYSAGPVTPSDSSSHAHPVPHFAASENTGWNCPAAAAADPTAHQHVGTTAAGTGMISNDGY